MKKVKKPAGRSHQDHSAFKREIIGIIFMLGSFFLLCFLLGFHADDEATVGPLAWGEIFSKAVKPVSSPFGPLGAKLSAFIIHTYGFTVILPTLSTFFCGLSLYRAKSIKPALSFFLYSVIISLDLAAMFGLTSFAFSDFMAGETGRMLAERLKVIGEAGAWVLLAVIATLFTFYMGRRVLSAFKHALLGALGSINKAILLLAPRLERIFPKKKDRAVQLKEESAGRQAEPQQELPWASRQPLSVQAEEPLATLPENPEREEAAIDPAPAFPGDPEIIVRPTIHEQEADLDERKLKVKTKDREPYRFPSIDLLEKVPEDDDRIDERHLAESKRKLIEKLGIYKIEVVRTSATVGPRVTLFELELAPDVKVSRVKALENDLAMALAARGIRIIAPIPGKNAVGVEIPNGKPKTVWLRSVLQVEKFKNSRLTLPIVLGKTIANEVYIADLAAMPHLLIAGATGAGKSVCINVILSSLLYACSPDKVKFVLIDPKRVELFQYQHLKNHFLMCFPGMEERIITDPQKAVFALRCVVKEMEMRYETLEKACVRNIGDHNRRFPDEALPYIVVVIDELADLMITAGRDVEEPITRIAQLARAVGIHLIVATQRPSVDVITGIIKANFPARIAFQVASRIDSRTILDGSGAEQLLGNGDMLYQPSDQPKSMRLQGPYVSSGEVEEITSFIGSQHGLKTLYMLPMPDAQKGGGGYQSSNAQEKDGRDTMFEEAARLVVMHQQASVSLLQRRLRLGFSRAGRVMDQLEYSGIVSEADGSRPREVLINNEDSLELLLRNLDE
ncbi:MAG: DNA translocase FtsK 4TM domain-containing protein [Chlorobiaceae bacterium]